MAEPGDIPLMQPFHDTRLFAYPLASRRAKNIPVICCEKKKKHSKYGAFLTLFCDKLWSHLQSD